MRNMAATADDCVALHFVPSDGGPWAGFLKTKLNEKRYGIQVQFYNALHDLPHSHKSAANVVLISPDFLNVQSFEKYSKFNPSTSLVVLLGTEENEYRNACSRNNGQFMNTWPIFETQQNESSVRALLVEIIGLYEHAHLLHDHDSPDDSDNDSERGLDSVSEKGLDTVSMISEVSGRGSEYDVLPAPRPVVQTRPPKSPKSPLADDKNSMLKAVTANNDTEVVVLMDKEGDGSVTVVIDDDEDNPIKCSHLNAAVFTCNIPKSRRPDASGKLSIKYGGKNVGKLRLGPSRTSVAVKKEDPLSDRGDKLALLSKILDSETDPICMMCKALRLPDTTREALDHALADKCHVFRRLEALKNLMLDEKPTSAEDKGSKWPTLLHFCAEYNLIKFCDELLHFPAMLQSCQIINKQGETPEQTARRLGHIDLGDLLESSLVQQREKRNSPGNKDSGYVGDLPMPVSSRSEINEDDDEGEEYMNMDKGGEDYMPMDQKSSPPNIRNDSVLEDDEDDDDENKEQDEYMQMDQKLSYPKVPTKGKEKEEEEDDSQEDYMKMEQSIGSPKLRDDSITAGDDDEDDVYKVPPPQPHAMKRPAYMNRGKPVDEDDDDNENDDTYQVPPEPRPMPCPNRTIPRKKREPVPTPPPDYFHSEAPLSEYMDMSCVKKDLPSPHRCLDSPSPHPRHESPSPRPCHDSPSPHQRIDVRLSGPEDSPSPRQSIISQSSTSSEGLISPEQGVRDYSFQSSHSYATMPRAEVPHGGAHGGDQMVRSHSESDGAHLYHPHSPYSPQSPHPKTRHRSLSEQGDQGPSNRQSKGWMSKLSHKLHFPHGKNRKQSLPDITIPEEVLHKAKKKDKHKASVEQRISDASTGSTTSNSSNDGSGVEKREKSSKEEKPKKKSKKLFGKKKTSDVSDSFEQLECVEENRRKSVRIAHVMKDDNLTVLDLPGKNY